MENEKPSPDTHLAIYLSMLALLVEPVSILVLYVSVCMRMGIMALYVSTGMCRRTGILALFMLLALYHDM